MTPGSETSHVLTSWKDIARYMGKGVRTVQRWEQDFGLPVRRPFGSNKKAVLARPRDLDAWVALRCSSRTQVATMNLQLPEKDRARQQSVSVLASLAAQIETHRTLQKSNRALMMEVSTALAELRNQLESTRAVSKAS